jgi:hypothetical protein
VLRDCLSGEVLFARSLLSACEADLANLLREVQQGIDVPIRGVISNGQRSLRNAIQAVLPDIPHQLCHFHYLKEAAKPVYEADKHAKKELKKQLRSVRLIERAVEHRTDEEAEAIRGYCLALRSALTGDGRPPLAAPSAESRNLFGNDKMRLIASPIISTDALSQLFGSQQAICLDDVALAMNPFGLNGVEPGTRASATEKAGYARRCPPA